MSILDLPHGVHLGFPEADYHARIRGLASKHALDLVARSPAHYAAWIKGAEREDTDAFAFGRAFHCALLEPERFIETYTVEPSFGDCRKKENKANRDAWRKDNDGAVLLSSDDHRSCRAMAESIRVHRIASKLLIGGDAEVTMRWRDEATGLECKGRADYYVPARRLVVDVKTADDASPEAFRRSMARYGYARQDAFYRSGFGALGKPIEFFVFLVVEKTPPFAVALYVLDEDGIRRGTESVQRDLETLAHAVEHDVWPAYGDSIQTLALPGWAA